ncbi:ArsR family transcriptional regulator [Ktedonosporobacter rubrisoli]|uniref:ArsR family transcriptional regulator n=1 Tax=Ktedonosporobacter rubrisoli TaxID=2509675 RepID=A0A4P6K075_KTERU|nr:metalloregulator ArsR/SmtB family transcription factor [Ktedonosporobacter rubrisoli]QBD81020.1 ArsR family transcriptional regulator [Ktedonosporobacter rubrisoli]
MTTDAQTQRVFLALADPTRRLLLQHLCEEGSGTAAGFATRLPITRQAIIKHLVTLEQAGLVTARETGRERRYMPRPEALQTVTAWIGDIEAQWDQRLADLRSYLLEEPGTSSVQVKDHSARKE